MNFDFFNTDRLFIRILSVLTAIYFREDLSSTSIIIYILTFYLSVRIYDYILMFAYLVHKNFGKFIIILLNFLFIFFVLANIQSLRSKKTLFIQFTNNNIINFILGISICLLISYIISFRKIKFYDYYMIEDSENEYSDYSEVHDNNLSEDTYNEKYLLYSQILGVNENDTLEDIKKKYKKKILQYHPDKNKSESAEEKAKLLNEAYDFMKKHNNKNK